MKEKEDDEILEFLKQMKQSNKEYKDFLEKNIERLIKEGLPLERFEK